MAYDRAPRRSLCGNSQTGPNISPNSYQPGYDDTCLCNGKGTNWAPFLSCTARNTTVISTSTPGPATYFPKSSNKIIGGSSLSNTAPRFSKTLFLTPAPTEHDPYHICRELTEKSPPRPVGFLYHCSVPYTMLSYMPTIPSPSHFGYDILQDGTMVECCSDDNDTTLGPAFYNINYDTFGTCYRGCYWSKYSRRKLESISDTPGVGAYNLEPQPSQLEEYLTKLRHERKKNSVILRYLDQVLCQSMKNDFPAPNQYLAEKAKCVKIKKKMVPKKLNRPHEAPKKVTESPAPNQYNDPRTAFEYLTKPSCKKELNAFLTNSPRFKKENPEKRPAPNEYHIKSFLEELAKKISPYAIRKTAFDTSVPKKLHYLLPDYPVYIKRKRCRCSEIPREPEPVVAKQKPVYPFTSKARRFTTIENGYSASCASYDIRKAFLFAKAQKSFRKAKKYDFLFTEERFAKFNGFGASEDKSYVPGLIYNLLNIKQGRANNTGSFARAEDIPLQENITPGPSAYNIISNLNRQTFNVTLKGSDSLTPFEKYRMKLRQKFFKPEIVSKSKRQVKISKSNYFQVENLEFEPPSQVKKDWGEAGELELLKKN